jgi:hypothetical protein
MTDGQCTMLQQKFSKEWRTYRKYLVKSSVPLTEGLASARVVV